MPFHPKLVELLKFQEELPICPFCNNPLRKTDHDNDYYICECSKNTRLLAPTNEPDHSASNKEVYVLEYSLIVNKKLKISIEFDFHHQKTYIFGLGDMITASHTNFPIFNEMAMRHKIRIYLPFI